MKKTCILLCAAAIFAAGCSRLPAADPPGTESELTVNLCGLPDTKATPGTDAENAVNSLSLYVFDADGMLDIVHACTSDEIGRKTAKFPVKTGVKTVYAVANMNETVASRANATYLLSDLEAVSYSLSDNRPSGLLMRGSMPSVAVSAASGGAASVDLVRGVARISLGSVKNNLPAPYGTVKVVHAFLCNVVGNQNLKGNAAADPASFLNRDATRGHVRSQVIGTGSNTAECPDLTFCTLGDDIASGATKTYGNRFFYAFPNALTTPNNGFSEPFTPTATVLMTVVRIKDRNYYYPVALKGGLAANTEYRVDLTVSGLGNKEDDPFAKIDKGELTATVQVLPWTTGTPVSENI
jgi:hypothetical protein